MHETVVGGLGSECRHDLGFISPRVIIGIQEDSNRILVRRNPHCNSGIMRI